MGSLIDEFMKLPGRWRPIFFFAGVLLVVFVCYLAAVAMPAALAAVNAGRGITLWVLEISPNKACEHAHEILASSAVNNETALYGQLTQALLDSSESALRAGNLQTGDAAERFLSRSKSILDKIDQVRTEQDKIVGQREALFEAVNAGCLKRDPASKTELSWPMVGLVLGTMFLLLLFVYLVFVRPLKAGS